MTPVLLLDAVETMFSLSPVEEALVLEGEPTGTLPLFFTRLLRDAFALSLTDAFRPFSDVGDGALRVVSPTLDADARGRVLAAFTRLPAHPDVAPAIALARRAGWSVAVLSNGRLPTTRALVERNGLADAVDEVLTVEDAGAYKPSGASYATALRHLGRSAGDAALVAAHAWDCHGAKRAGLRAGWVSRLEGVYAPVYDRPDVTGDTLVEVVGDIVALEGQSSP